MISAPKTQPLDPVPWFQARGISAETVTRYAIAMQRRGDIGEAIVFPFVKDGKVVNRKYRGRGKAFRQDKDAVKCFWNHDVLADPALTNGEEALIITEGEMDALSAIEAGFPLTVSVPDGAPSPKMFGAEAPIDPETDKKFSYVWDAWDHLEKIKRIVLAVDADGPGGALAAELVRRLGPVRCAFVTYPDGSKDLNDVLMAHGGQAVADCLTTAKPYPIKGLYKLSDYPEVAEPPMMVTGWPHLDPHLKLYKGEFVLVTGIPGHGKSTWLLALLANLIRAYGLTICLASFEMRIAPYVRDALRKDHGGGETQADQWIEQFFVFLDQDPRGDDTDMDLTWVLDKAADAVLRYSIDVLVIDPWNEMEQARGPRESETDYVNRAVKALKHFARAYDVLVIVVAHPVKMGGGRDGIKKPNLYDVSGSANWYNKCDCGIVIYREFTDSSYIEVDVKKSRYKSAGVPGSVYLEYNELTGRFCERPDETVGSYA